MIETQSHRAAFDTLIAMGKLFYSGARIVPGIRLRLFPLVIGPTGVGKSFLVERAARALRADYLKLTRGDWVVVGARAGRPTMHQILDRVVASERVLVHLDELDKFHDLRSGEWSSAIGSDLWNLLDGKLQIGEYLRESGLVDGKKPSALSVGLRLQGNLWIVGSGTWQEIFEKSRHRSAVGFRAAGDGDTVDLAAIAKSGVISPELLHRFNGDPLFLDYPSREETAHLLESSGIAKLARDLGQTVKPDDVDWVQGGMRAVETIVTRLALAFERRPRPRQVTIPLLEDNIETHHP